MIPLRSTERTRSRAPITLLLILVNVVLFVYQAQLATPQLHRFLLRWGIVPDHLSLPTLLTSMFLHGGWLHLIGNMWFLWIFGRGVEDRLGGPRYLGFYLLCGIAAGLIHIVSNPYSRVPTIGASGAIAGVMGAYLAKFPHARIVTLVPIIVFFTLMEIPAYFLLAYWFVIQFLSGVGSLADTDYTGGGVAWFAHIGGFLAGWLIVRTFRERRRWHPSHWE